MISGGMWRMGGISRVLKIKPSLSSLELIPLDLDQSWCQKPPQHQMAYFLTWRDWNQGTFVLF